MILKVNQLYGRNVKTITETAMEKLRSYHWPGNIRELENVIGRAVIFMDVTEEVINYHHLPNLQMESKVVREQNSKIVKEQTLQDAMEQYEKEYIYHIYKENNFNKTKTAKKLNISVRNLYYKIDKYELE